MRTILGAIFLLSGVVAIFFDTEIFEFGIQNNLPWTFSKLLTWVLVLLLSVIAVVLIKAAIRSKKVKISLIIGGPLLMLAAMFALNPIYSGDYVKKGTELNIESHEILNIVEEYKEGFNGLLAIVDYNCPFCKKATRDRLKVISKRNADIDLALTLNTADTTTITNYIKETNSSELNYIYHSPKQSVVELVNGKFPTFVYIKKGEIVHKWMNSELGFPALDWIESGLK